MPALGLSPRRWRSRASKWLRQTTRQTRLREAGSHVRRGGAKRPLPESKLPARAAGTVCIARMAGASRTRRLPLGLLGHLQVMLHDRQSLLNVGLEARILHPVFRLLQVLDILLVILDLSLNEGTVKGLAVKLLEPVAQGVVLAPDAGRSLDTLLPGDLRQLLVGLLMVGGKMLAQHLHVLARRFLLRELPQFDLRPIVARHMANELAVGGLLVRGRARARHGAGFGPRGLCQNRRRGEQCRQRNGHR